MGGGTNPDQWTQDKRGRFGGIFSRYQIKHSGGTWDTKYGDKIEHWDIAPGPEYFSELFRVSKHQIIWGGNYFDLPPARCFVVWDKLNISEAFSMAMCEYAWTSFDANAKIYRAIPQDPERFHPTQKPVALYSWLLNQYANQGDKILDTHAGSASSLVACQRAGYSYLGFELDKDYFDKAQARLAKEREQVTVFENNKEQFFQEGLLLE